MDDLKKFLGEKPLKKLAVIFASLLAFIVILSIILIKINDPKVKINFSEKTNIPGSELTKIRSNLYGVIRDNSENFDQNKVFEGDARNYQESKKDKTSTATFIVDFNDIKQSYSVSVSWPDPETGAPNIIISCPLLDSKYPETPCKTESNSSTELVSYLPYTKTLSSGEEYIILYKYSNSEPYIEVQINSCGNKTLINTALNEIKEWIKSIHINPEDYKIFAPIDLCDGEAHSSEEGDEPLIKNVYISGNTLKTKDENINQNLPYFIPNMYNVYPITDQEGNVTSIKAELTGCTDAQTDPMEQEINLYLTSRNINYKVNFEYCKI